MAESSVLLLLWSCNGSELKTLYGVCKPSLEMAFEICVGYGTEKGCTSCESFWHFCWCENLSLYFVRPETYSIEDPIERIILNNTYRDLRRRLVTWPVMHLPRALRKKEQKVTVILLKNNANEAPTTELLTGVVLGHSP